MKYIRLFFTTLGYFTFIALVGGLTFIYVGQLRKEGKSTITFHDNTDTIGMTPKKEPIELIEPTPISRPAAKDHLVDPPAKRTKKAVTKPTPSPKPTPKPVTAPAPKPVAYTAPKQTKQAKPKRTRQASAPIADAAPKPELGTSILRYQVTDRTSSPRTGHGIVNMDVTSDLEKAAIRRAKAINELSAAADKIRNPQ